ncbi:MAG: type II toxin-antitoxin system HicB family antitoxin [Sutterellaceae bacterium]|nr:type II toxin-antitoxin system HicB family antitoxin [Sutterellaceae bacterium]
MPSTYRFPAQVESNGAGGFIASFKDVPEALTEAPTMEELKANAVDALITAIDFYIEDHRHFPEPSPVTDQDLAIQLPPSVIAKVMLLNAMVDTNTRPIDLARKLGTSRQEVTRITDLHHATKIDTIARALYALGRQLNISVSAV